MYRKAPREDVQVRYKSPISRVAGGGTPHCATYAIAAVRGLLPCHIFAHRFIVPLGWVSLKHSSALHRPINCRAVSIEEEREVSIPWILCLSFLLGPPKIPTHSKRNTPKKIIRNSKVRFFKSIFTDSINPDKYIKTHQG
jgi:hypothetical protein